MSIRTIRRVNGREEARVSTFDQAEFEVRFEWGLAGLNALAPVSDTVVIVDVRPAQ